MRNICFVLSVLVFCFTQVILADSQKCSDIEKVDTKNFKIIQPEKKDDGGGGRIEFVDGKGKEFWDMNADHPEIPEFELEQKGSFIFKPVSDLKLKVIKLRRIHLRGSGSGEAALVLTCSKGQLAKSFFDSGEVSIKNGKLHLQGFEYMGAKGEEPRSDWQWELVWNPKRGTLDKVKWTSK